MPAPKFLVSDIRMSAEKQSSTGPFEIFDDVCRRVFRLERYKQMNMIRHNFHLFDPDIRHFGNMVKNIFHFIHKSRRSKHLTSVFSHPYQMKVEVIHIPSLVYSAFYSVYMPFHMPPHFFLYNSIIMKRCSQMNYHYGVVLKIYPSDAQKHIIAVNDGAQRAVYNLLVGVDKEIYRLKKTADIVPVDRKRLEDVTLKIRDLNGSGSDTAHIRNTLPFLNEPEIDGQVIATAKKNYSAAWKNMRERHTGVPTFHKKSYAQSYQTSNHYVSGHKGLNGGSIRFLDESHIQLPIIGRIRCSGSPEIISRLFSHSDQTRIGTVTVSRDAVGEYWVSLQIASDDSFVETLPETGSEVGLDLNLIELVNDSDGGSFENLRFRKSLENKLAKTQKKLSRRAEQAKKDKRKLHDSRNYQMQRQKVAYLQRKIARQRAD
jgi:putative transposase